MKLIMIRHAEPDYEKDSLTGTGFREAEILAGRVAGWKVTDFYCSPMGRARATAAPSLDLAGRDATVKPWLKEFDIIINDPWTGERKVCWDLKPEYLNEHPELFDARRWQENPMITEAGIGKYYNEVMEQMDLLLASYGYIREGINYRTGSRTKREAVVVCFCHLGVTCAIMSHLLNMAPHQLWQGFFLAPTSVTVLGTEERSKRLANFRCQVMGDTSHLREAKEPVSYYASFTEPFQG